MHSQRMTSIAPIIIQVIKLLGKRVMFCFVVVGCKNLESFFQPKKL